MDATHPPRRVISMLAIGIGLFVVLNIGDLVSTYVALGGGFREGNPLMRALLARYGFAALILYKVGVIATVGVGVLLLRRSHPRLAQVTLAVCIRRGRTRTGLRECKIAVLGTFDEADWAVG